MRASLVAIALVVASGIAAAQPERLPPPVAVASDPSSVLREANAAASAGDWPRVAQLVDPLLVRKLERADEAEAHRLAGLAAYFLQRTADAEREFLAYLRIDVDGHLDPALYPPEVVYFFDDVRARHAAELRARRPHAKRYWLLNLVPPFGQFQNGDRTKAWIVTGALGTFVVANATSYFVLKSWCSRVQNPMTGQASTVCDDGGNHPHAGALRTINLVSGIGLIATYVWGVYDGVRNYRHDRRPSFAPYSAATSDAFVVGVGGQW